MRRRYPVIGTAGLIVLALVFLSQEVLSAERIAQLRIPGCGS